MFTTRQCVCVVVFVGLVSFSSVGVAQETARTPWGDPDLQGLFDYATITPMVRPAEYGDQEFLTDEEAAELEQGAIDRDKFMTSQLLVYGTGAQTGFADRDTVLSINASLSDRGYPVRSVIHEVIQSDLFRSR